MNWHVVARANDVVKLTWHVRETFHPACCLCGISD